MSVTATWVTSADVGVIAFPTKGAAVAAFPDRRAQPCVFAFGFRGWLSLSPHGTDNGNTVKTPAGAEISVVAGWIPDVGYVMGVRGLTVHERYSDGWRNIMARVIEAGLALHADRLARKDRAYGVPVAGSELVGKTYRSTDRTPGGFAPVVEFVVAHVRRDERGTTWLRSERGFQWYPLCFATVE